MKESVGKPIEQARRQGRKEKVDLSKAPVDRTFKEAIESEGEPIEGQGPEDPQEQRPEHPMAKTLRSLADKVEAGACITVLLSAAFINEPPLTISHGDHWGSKLAMVKRLNLKVDDEFAHETFPKN